MKKTAIALIVAGFAATGVQAAPQNNTWYAGAKLGWSAYYDTDLTIEGKSVTDAMKLSQRRNQVGAGAFVGYQVNPYIGFEMGYDWFGRMPYKGDELVNTSLSGSFRLQGIQLATKLSYPILPSLDIYTRLGAMAWRADAKGSVTSGFLTGSSQITEIRKHDTGVSPLVALGVEYAITKSIATRLDYQWVDNAGDTSSVGMRPDNGMLTLGLSYRFGQSDYTTSAAMPAAPLPQPVLVPGAEVRRFTLNSEVLFAFNKSVLRAEGHQELDRLYAQLNSMDPKNSTAIVLGFTDSLGSDTYNQKLSEERARSVAAYLVAKGIPADKISSRGMGKANPVTGTACHHVKHRHAMIECLAPDRRVDIEIHGTKEVR